MADTDKNFSEQTITELLHQDSRQAFNILYDKYAAALFGFITRIAGEKAAENILQQTFIEVWKNRKTLQHTNETVFVQMFKIARRLAIEAVRSKCDSGNHDLLCLVYSTAVENFLTGRNNTEIGEPAKSALQLIYFKFYTPEEAVTKLNISIQTLAMKVKLAIEKLNAVEA
jgi:RNA polymerase sigma-70 factor (ECF subfamily)